MRIDPNVLCAFVMTEKKSQEREKKENRENILLVHSSGNSSVACSFELTRDISSATNFRLKEDSRGGGDCCCDFRIWQAGSPSSLTELSAILVFSTMRHGRTCFPSGRLG